MPHESKLTPQSVCDAADDGYNADIQQAIFNVLNKSQARLRKDDYLSW